TQRCGEPVTTCDQQRTHLTVTSVCRRCWVADSRVSRKMGASVRQVHLGRTTVAAIHVHALREVWWSCPPPKVGTQRHSSGLHGSLRNRLDPNSVSRLVW